MRIPNIQKENTWLTTCSLAILAGVALAMVLFYTRPVTVPFVLALFIVSIVSPVLDFQVMRLKFPRSIAVMVSLLAVLVIIAFACLMVVEGIQTIISTAGRYSDSFANLAEKAVREMERLGIELSEEQVVNDLRDKIPALVTNAFGTVFGFTSSFFFVLIFVIFLLAGRNPHIVRSGVYADIDMKIRRYIVIKILISAMTGSLVWMTLGLFGLELAGVFGALAFFLNFIPSIGSVIATLLPIPIAAAQFQNLWLVVLVVTIPGVIQLAIGNIAEPKLMGKELSLHPITILLALAFWGLLWGIVGMLLAVPITAIIRIVLMQFDALKPVGNLLVGQLPKIKTQAEV